MLRAIPLETAAAACSRIPKCRLRPERESSSKPPAPGKVRLVLVDGDRSAEPPSEPRDRLGQAVEDLAEESRLAMPLASAAKVGAGRPPSRREAGGAERDRARRPAPGSWPGTSRTTPPTPRRASAPLAANPAAKAHTPRRERRSRCLRACRGTVWWSGRHRRRAAPRGPWASPRAASRSRCGCGPGSASGRWCSERKTWKATGDRVEIVGVGHGGDVPAVGKEAGGHILGEGDVGVPFDRHPVGVVDPAQVGQAQMTGERRRLLRRSPPSCSRPRPGRRR